MKQSGRRHLALLVKMVASPEVAELTVMVIMIMNRLSRLPRKMIVPQDWIHSFSNESKKASGTYSGAVPGMPTYLQISREVSFSWPLKLIITLTLDGILLQSLPLLLHSIVFAETYYQCRRPGVMKVKKWYWPPSGQKVWKR